MTSILLTLNALICVALVILILLQRGDPASGGMFGGAGGGGNQAVIRNPLAKPTAVLAALFLVFSLTLAYLNKGAGHGDSVMTTHGEEQLDTSALLPQPSLLGTASATVPAPVMGPETVSATGQ